jgi:hypothetical protein
MAVDFTKTRSRYNTNYTTNADHCTGILQNRYIYVSCAQFSIVTIWSPGNMLFFRMSPNMPVDVWKKKVGRHRFTKHVPFNTNHLYQSITPHSTLNATQLTKTEIKHVKITPFSLPITLKFTFVSEYDHRPHRDTQTEWNIHELTKCN